MAKRRFRPVPGNEDATHQSFEDFMGGPTRAFQMLHLWQDTYRTGTLYDRDFKTGFYHSKTDNFKRKARNRGFTEEEIDAFLSLQ